MRAGATQPPWVARLPGFFLRVDLPRSKLRFCPVGRVGGGEAIGLRVGSLGSVIVVSKESVRRAVHRIRPLATVRWRTDSAVDGAKTAFTGASALPDFGTSP